MYRCLGYSIKNVYNRAKIFSLVIVGKTAHSISQEVTNDELVVRRESQSARRATIVSLTPHDERLREDVAKETHQVEIVQTDSKPTLSEQNERTHPL